MTWFILENAKLHLDHYMGVQTEIAKYIEQIDLILWLSFDIDIGLSIICVH